MGPWGTHGTASTAVRDGNGYILGLFLLKRVVCELEVLWMLVQIPTGVIAHQVVLGVVDGIAYCQLQQNHAAYL